MRKFLFLTLTLVATAAFAGRVDYVYSGAGTETPGAFNQGQGQGYYAALVETDGPLILDVVNTIPADDTSPDVAGGNTFKTSANTGATVIDALDNEYPGAYYTIYCGNTTNASTITDGGNFTLDGNWTPTAVGDSITLFVTAANTYIEVARSYATAGLLSTVGSNVTYKYASATWQTLTASATTYYHVFTPNDNVQIDEIAVWSHATPVSAAGTVLLNVYCNDVSGPTEEQLQETADYDLETIAANTGTNLPVQTTTPANLAIDALDPVYVRVISNNAIGTNSEGGVTVKYHNR